MINGRIAVLLFFLLLGVRQSYGMLFSLKERIEGEPHTLINGRSTSLEFGYERFFSIPELGQSSASINHSFAKYAIALSLSSLYLDSIYREVTVVPGFACAFERLKWGAALSLEIKDAGGEPFYEKSISISAAFDISSDWQIYLLPPSVEFEIDNINLAEEWAVGADLRYQPLSMTVGTALYHNINGEFGLRISQFWKAGSNIAFYGSFESEPLKICLGFSCYYRRLSAGVKFDKYPSIGSVQRYYTGYGSVTP